MSKDRIPAIAALNILSLYNHFGKKISKKRILEVWKKNPNANYEQLKALLALLQKEEEVV